MPKEPLTISRAAEVLMRYIGRYDGYPLVLRHQALIGGQGGYPTIPLTSMYLGGDWNSGKMFVEQESPVALAGDEFEKERATVRELNQKLGWMYYVINGPLDDKEKVKALKRMMKEKQRAAS